MNQFLDLDYKTQITNKEGKFGEDYGGTLEVMEGNGESWSHW